MKFLTSLLYEIVSIFIEFIDTDSYLETFETGISKIKNTLDV